MDDDSKIFRYNSNMYIFVHAAIIRKLNTGMFVVNINIVFVFVSF